MIAAAIERNAEPCLERLIPLLQCPASGQRLVAADQTLSTPDGRHRYPLSGGIPDLRHPPRQTVGALNWYEPWDELSNVILEPPQAGAFRDVPRPLDRHNAAILGNQGDNRWVLEVGCAERSCERYLAERGFNYVGIDIEPRGRGPHILADAHNLPFADGSFDICFSKAVYEHLLCPLTAVRETFRILRPGGIFFGSVSFVEPFHDHASFYHMTHAGVLVLLRTAGFEVRRIWPGNWPYYRSIPAHICRGPIGRIWQWSARVFGPLWERSYLLTSNLARIAAGRPTLSHNQIRLISSGAIDWLAVKPLE